MLTHLTVRLQSTSRKGSLLPLSSQVPLRTHCQQDLCISKLLPIDFQVTALGIIPLSEFSAHNAANEAVAEY